jgi:hypothetical protein
LYRRKGGWYTLKSWETITVEKHLDESIHISKNGIYIDHKISFERPLMLKWQHLFLKFISSRWTRQC